MWEVYLKGKQDFPEKHYFGVEVRESSFVMVPSLWAANGRARLEPCLDPECRGSALPVNYIHF